MPVLATILVLYTLMMLALHVSSWKVMQSWQSANETWTKRWLPTQRAVRFEAAYWLIALIGWSLWGPFVKIVIALFGAIHIGLWASMEVKHKRNFLHTPGDRSNQGMMVAVAAFDFVECFALVAAGYSAALYLFHW